MRDSHNNYGPSAGIPAAREAVAAEYTANGFPVAADRVFITAGTSEGIELTLNAVIDAGGEVLVPMPTYPLYTAVLAKLGARAVFYRTDAARGWAPDVDHLRSLVTPATQALVIIDPNNPTGASYSAATRRALLDVADHFGRRSVRRSGPRGRRRAARQPGSGCGHHLVLESVQGLSCARLAHRLDGGRALAAPR
jgi:alanine-synthesizing transaminase